MLFSVSESSWYGSCGWCHRKCLNPLRMCSTMIRYIQLSKGPVKSICIWAHGLVGHCQGCKGAAGGDGWACWHSVQCLTVSSISRSIPGHHTNILARAFILEPPGCPLWSSPKTCSGFSGNGNLLRASALSYSLRGWNRKVYSYVANLRVHHWMLAVKLACSSQTMT